MTDSFFSQYGRLAVKSDISAPACKAERKQASVLSSEWCVSAAPAAFVFPSPVPAGAESPVAFASPDTPAVTNHCQFSLIT